MEKDNSIEFKVYGKKALFSEPITRTGRELQRAFTGNRHLSGTLIR